MFSRNYQQQSFIVGPNSELYLEETFTDKIKDLEDSISYLYEEFYEPLRMRQINTCSFSILSHTIFSFFNQNSNFYEIQNCSREVQIQAFNLFNECCYLQIMNVSSLGEEFYSYVQKVMTFGEEVLSFVPSNVPSDIDFGIKGLVKSELYKHHNFMTYRKQSTK